MQRIKTCLLLQFFPQRHLTLREAIESGKALIRVQFQSKDFALFLVFACKVNLLWRFAFVDTFNLFCGGGRGGFLEFVSPGQELVDVYGIHNVLREVLVVFAARRGIGLGALVRWLPLLDLAEGRGLVESVELLRYSFSRNGFDQLRALDRTLVQKYNLLKYGSRLFLSRNQSRSHIQIWLLHLGEAHVCKVLLGKVEVLKLHILGDHLRLSLELGARSARVPKVSSVRLFLSSKNFKIAGRWHRNRLIVCPRSRLLLQVELWHRPTRKARFVFGSAHVLVRAADVARSICGDVVLRPDKWLLLRSPGLIFYARVDYCYARHFNKITLSHYQLLPEELMAAVTPLLCICLAPQGPKLSASLSGRSSGAPQLRWVFLLGPALTFSRGAGQTQSRGRCGVWVF